MGSKKKRIESVSDTVEIVIRDDLRQRDVVKFEQAVEELDERGALALFGVGAKPRGIALKAAIAAGWIKSPECKQSGQVYLFDGQDVDDADPMLGLVSKHGDTIYKLWLVLTQPPKN